MKKLLIKNGFLIVVLVASVFILIFMPAAGQQALAACENSLVNFVVSITPIFVIVGLLDVWVKKEAMMAIAGENTGIKGKIISFFLGILTAVPLYALLPIAGLLLKKGSKISNVLLFICASTTMRIPLLLFETSSMGWRFTAIRLVLNIAGIIIITLAIDKLLSDKDKHQIYSNAKKLS